MSKLNRNRNSRRIRKHSNRNKNKQRPVNKNRMLLKKHRRSHSSRLRKQSWLLQVCCTFLFALVVGGGGYGGGVCILHMELCNHLCSSIQLDGWLLTVLYEKIFNIEFFTRFVCTCPTYIGMIAFYRITPSALISSSAGGHMVSAKPNLLA